MSDLMKQKCPNCGWFEEFPEEDEPTTADEFNWAYSPTSYENRIEAIKKSEIRMRLEFGYGLPERNPDLDSFIRREWRQDENKKC
jgi:hypothetical protein